MSEQNEVIGQYTTLSEAEILAAYEGELCLVCEKRKASLAAFCVTDTLALPLWDRINLARGPKDPYFVDNFRSALRHLQLNTQRLRKYPAVRGEWPYQSKDDLEEAGYRLIDHARCKVPRCWEKIVWFFTPTGGRIAVNLADCQPHYSTCTDPDYMRRKREELQAQKQKKRRRR